MLRRIRRCSPSAIVGLSASLVAFFCLLTLFNESNKQPYTKVQSSSSGKAIVVPVQDALPSKQRTWKSVLLYTQLWYRHEWYGQSAHHLIDYTTKADCPVKECTFSYDNSNVGSFDALLFHFFDISYHGEQVINLNRINGTRRRDQRWIFFVHEPPFHPNIFPFTDMAGYFNWTMSYSRHSEVMLPYFRAKEQPSERGYVNHALGKTKQIAFASSHCGIFREKYVLELQKYISVTVFGKCSDRYKKSGACERGSAACAALMQQFKFYLAFESSFCHDYVTEKYWENSLMAGLVPVVMGANYDHLNSIPGSYIDVSDFPSIKALADHLLYLDKNDTAYNEYFKWKQSYTVVHNDMFCKLCQELHNENHPKRHVYDDLEAFWSKEEQCGKNSRKELYLAKQVEASHKLIL